MSFRFQLFSSDSSDFQPAGMQFSDERRNPGGSSAESSWSSSWLVGGAHHYSRTQFDPATIHVLRLEQVSSGAGHRDDECRVQ